MPGQKRMKTRGKAVQKKIQKHRTGKSQFKAITPGSGRSVSKAFGSSSTNSMQLSRHAWNALHPLHLALPRPVGPYTVIRLTRTFSTADRFVMIGCFAHRNDHSNRPVQANTTHAELDDSRVNHWSSVCALSAPEDSMFKDVAGTSGVGGSAAKFHMYTMSGLDNLQRNCQITPSAVTVQVMNFNSLQKTHGLCYAAVCPVEINHSTYGGHQKPNDIGQNMISYMKPRLLTLPKLAMAGVCAHSHPLDMNNISEFREIGNSTETGAAIGSGDDDTYYWGAPQQTSDAIRSETVDLHTQGWAPIVFYRPDPPIPPTQTGGTFLYSDDSVPQKLTYQVTIEYRVRFDLTNPASATHRFHEPAPMPTYTRMIKDSVRALPGILENVAEAATTAYAAGTALKALAA